MSATDWNTKPELLTELTSFSSSQNSTSAAVQEIVDIVWRAVEVADGGITFATEQWVNDNFQPLSADLTAISGLTGNGAATKTDGVWSLIGYLTEETDPVFTASAASEISSADITNWNVAFGWGDHSLAGYELLLNKNIALGYAGLDSDGKLFVSQLPELAITDTYVVSSEAAMLALSCQQGDVAVRTDENLNYILAGSDPSVIGNWTQLLTPTDSVLSVNGQTGNVVLGFDDLDSHPTTVAGYGITDALTEEVDTLATVTARGNSTPTSININNSDTFKYSAIGSSLAFFKADAADSSGLQMYSNAIQKSILRYNSAAAGTQLYSSTPATVLQSWNDDGTIDIVGDTTVSGNITSDSFVTSGGTSSQFVKGDGSLDSSTYLTSETDTLATVTARGATSNKQITISEPSAQTQLRVGYNQSQNNALLLYYGTSSIGALQAYGSGNIGDATLPFRIYSENGHDILLDPATGYRTVNDGDMLINGDLIVAGGDITLSTADGADSARLNLCGGGAVGSTRGGYISVFGNEEATRPGQVLLVAGTDSRIEVIGDQLNNGDITATSFITSGGTSSQFVKGDGSLDSSIYLTSETDTLATVTARGATSYNSINIQSTSDEQLRLGYTTSANNYLSLYHNTSRYGGLQVRELDLASATLPLRLFTDSGHDILLDPGTGRTVNDGDLDVSGNITSDSFVTSGGTSSQFVKGDGSLDGAGTNYTTGWTATNGGGTVYQAQIMPGNQLHVRVAITPAASTYYNGSAISYLYRSGDVFGLGSGLTNAIVTTGVAYGIATVGVSNFSIYFDGSDTRIMLIGGSVNSAYGYWITGIFPL